MVYVCSNCGYKTPKWLGKCLGCNEWDTLILESNEKIIKKPVISLKPKKIDSIIIDDEERLYSGITEFDRVLGGGLVKGSVVLLSGEPGIGKSTLLLQVLGRYSKNSNVLYLSGEESESQIKSRANRISSGNDVDIISSSDIDASLAIFKNYDVIAIDSIQTMKTSEIGSVQGTISQIRESLNRIIPIAKENNISFIIVGHVNKDGKIAGPKMLEHMVDTLIEFEGSKEQDSRILRSSKNRFGSINEIGIFEMSSKGVKEVADPSSFFVADRPNNIGSILTPIVEGNRVFIIEVQALVTRSLFGMPRRITNGIDISKAQIISSIVEKYLNLSLVNSDIFFNIPGGIKVKDPSIDLAIALAIISSAKNIPIEGIVFGELGLSGEIRRVSKCDQRVKEISKLGYKKIYLPEYKETAIDKVNLIKVDSLEKISKIIL
jgi:DNA repair protein RadA/Sms